MKEEEGGCKRKKSGKEGGGRREAGRGEKKEIKIGKARGEDKGGRG